MQFRMKTWNSKRCVKVSLTICLNSHRLRAAPKHLRDVNDLLLINQMGQHIRVIRSHIKGRWHCRIICSKEETLEATGQLPRWHYSIICSKETLEATGQLPRWHRRLICSKEETLVATCQLTRIPGHLLDTNVRSLSR